MHTLLTLPMGCAIFSLKLIPQTVEAEITAVMPSQRACDAENQARYTLSNRPLRVHTPQIILQFFINILQRWRNFFLIRKDRKRKTMRLMFIVIRVLSQNQYFYLTKRCKMQCIKNILCRRIHNRAAILFFHKLIQLPVIWFGEFLTDCRKPVVCYHCHNFIHSYLRTETPRSAR